MRKGRLAGLRGISLALLTGIGCGGTPTEPAQRARAEPTPEPAPPEEVTGEIPPGRYFFPAQPIWLEGRKIGHLIGLQPVELLGATEEGYRIAIELDGARTEVEVSAFTPVLPHACTTRPATLRNGDLRVELAPGSVVAIAAMDERWAAIEVAIGASGVIPRSALSVEGCVTASEPPTGEVVPALVLNMGLTCLFPTREPSANTPAAEVPGCTPLRVLERAPGWLRVQARHGAATLEGWTPAIEAIEELPPWDRPAVISSCSSPRVPPTCRRTTRELELGGEVMVRVPPGSITMPSESWTDVYIPRGEGAYLRIRPSEVPEDALGPPETEGCALGAWEPWDLMQRWLVEVQEPKICFYPGMLRE